MSLILEGNIETNIGPVDNIYVKIDSLTIDKLKGTLTYSVMYWQDKATSETFKHLSHDPNISQTTRKIISSNEILVYNEKNKPTSISLPTVKRFEVLDSKEVEIELISSRMVRKDVPYVSFNSDGEEVEKMRSELVQEDFVSGTEVKKEYFFNEEILTNPFKLCYDNLKETISKEFSLLLTVKDD